MADDRRTATDAEWRRRLSVPATTARAIALALVVGAMAFMMFSVHRDGHWWGDDWALYLRQARGLVDGDPGRVLTENRFAVDHSLGSAFSPPLYPWGFPLLLAPFVAVLGTDVDRLTIVPVLCACTFACSWYALARPRLGPSPAIVGTVAVTITPLLLGWTELLQSEWPFLAVAGVVLVGLDRVAASGALVGRHAPIVPVVLLGIGAAAAFSVRREGLAMVAAIGAAQLAALGAAAMPPWRVRSVGPLLARLALPHAVALAAVGLLQILLPSTLVPRYEGTSVANVWRFAGEHVHHLAQVSGLERPWDAAPSVLGSEVVGWLAVALYLAAAAVGAALAVGRHARRDLHLLVYAVVALTIGGSFRVAINRYVATVGPILVLLGLVAVSALAARVVGRRGAAAVATVLVALIAVGNVATARDRAERARAFAAEGRVEWGPTHPAAREMFAAVRSRTGPDEVVAAPKARAMTLLTDRLAVQVDDFRPIPSGPEPALVVVERGTGLDDDLRARPDRYHLVWENSRFALFDPISGSP